jgi:multidrug efflux pump subunit AcrA (membrane-fusion protein)
MSGCQVLAPQANEPALARQSQPEPGRLVNRTAPTTAVRAAAPELTATVKRGTLRDTISLAGQVVPARTAQLGFRTGGVVQAVHVRSGQAVKKGDPLADLALDEAALQSAQIQATVAELAYQNQQARVNELRQGVGVGTVEEARASVTKARVALVEATVARTGAGGQQSTELRLAQLALDQANDELVQAQAAARHTEDRGAEAAAAVRAAERKVEEAAIRRDQLRTTVSTTPAAREAERERARLEVDQARQDLARAQLAAQRSEEDAGSLPASAATALRSAERRVIEATLKLEDVRAGPTSVPDARDVSVQRAQYEVNQYRQELASARSALRRIQDAASAAPTAVLPWYGSTAMLTPQVALTPVPTPQLFIAGVAVQGSAASAAASAAVYDAERKLLDAVARLEQLTMAPTRGDRGDVLSREAEERVAQLELDAARAELATAQVAAQRSQQDAAASPAGAALAVRAAERRLADASAKLEQLESGGPTANPTDVRLAELALERANDELAQAQALARREREAAEASASTTALAVRAAERKLTEASLKFEQARATVERSLATQGMQRQLPDLQVAIAEATLAAAEARLRDLLSDSGRAQDLQRETVRVGLLRDEAIAARNAAQPVVVLVAPFDGTVTRVEVSVNQTVEPKGTAIRLDDPSQLSVVATASESEVSRLAIDHPVEVVFPGITDDAAKGTISEVSGVATRQGDKVAFPVRVDIERMPAAVRLGMTATVNITTRLANDILYIPASAIRMVGNQAVATRVSLDRETEEVPVAVGGIFAGDVEIILGLREGDIVGVYPSAPSAGTSQTVSRGTRQ